ncbi:MAG: phage tail tape measure protein [Aeromicrobium sp.]|uniref:phage tail tape measure protein n=1 Tax=Aeromicrobium sp. TaxID=1871063 RepID=UPI0039E3F190
MALDLGELYGTLGLDDKPFQAGLDAAEAGLDRFGSDGAKKAIAIGAGVGLALAASLAQNVSAEAANDKLAAQFGMTEAEAARAGKVAGSLYSQAYGDSMGQVNDAIGAVMGSIDGMREASAGDLEEVAGYALNLAEAFEIDVGRSAQIAGQMVSSGLAKNATEAFDLITAGAQKVGPTLAGDLMDAVDEYGGYFAQIGLSGEQAMSMLAAASEKGMYGIDKTGDAIGEFTKLVVGDMAKTRPVIESLGLDYDKTANDVAAGGERGRAATMQIVDALMGIDDPAAQARASMELFGTPLEDLGTDYVPTFLSSLSDTTGVLGEVGGASERFGEQLNSNASTALTELKRQGETAFMSLMNWALPVFSTITQAAAEHLVPALAGVGRAFKWLGEHEGLMKALGATLAVVVAPAALVLAVNLVAAAGAGIASAASAAANVLAWSAYAVVIGTLRVATAAWTAAQWLLNAALAANPVGLIVIGLVALAALFAVLWMKSETFRDIVTGVFDAVGSAAQRLWSGIQAAFGFIGEAIGFYVDMVQVYIGIWVAAFNMVVDAALWLWAGIQNAFNLVVAAIGVYVGLVKGYIDMWISAFGWLISKALSLPGVIGGAIGSVVSTIGGLGGRVLSALSGAGRWLVDVGKDVMRGLRDGIEAGFDWVKDKLSGVGKAIPGWLKDVLGISSPSKVLRDQVGRWIPAGIAVGIEDGSSAVEAAMADLMAIPEVYEPLPSAYTAGPVRGGDGAAMGDQIVLHQTVNVPPGIDPAEIGDYAANAAAHALAKRGTG